jgi:hypothetical protein
MTRLLTLWLGAALTLACTRADKISPQDTESGTPAPAIEPATAAAPPPTAAPAAAPPANKGNPMTTLTQQLDAVRVFANDDGSDLFSGAAMRAIAGVPNADQELVVIIESPSEPIERRFSAVEAALQKGLPADLLDATTTAKILEVVVAAIPKDKYHNRWGLPGHSLGRLSKRLLKLPGLDDSMLEPLLGDSTPLVILGSESATIQSTHKYRVADLAAFMIARARKIDYADDRDPAVRDRFIAGLRK